MTRRPAFPSWLIATVLLLAIGLSLSAHAQSAATAASAAALPSVELPQAIDAVLRGYERAFRTRDGEALTALFAEDGFAMPEGRPALRGRAQLREAFAQVGGPLSLRALAFREQADLAVVVGAYRFANAADGRDDGKFVLTLVRAPRGEWRIFSDIDNGNIPARPAPARQP